MTNPQIIKDYRDKLTNSLIEQIEKGTAPWQIPWDKRSSKLPVNAITGKLYHGSNIINLFMHAQLKGYNDNRWCTYLQAKENGWSIKPGEKATYVYFVKFNVEHIKLDENNLPVKDSLGRDIKIKSSPISQIYPVFNGSQINGIPKLPEPKIHVWESNKRAENILINSRANIIHENSSQAYYNQIKDEIHLPNKGMFKDDQKYYSTALHELGHWTGHESRLKRDLTGFFGSEKYAREELKAEISSFFVSDQVGIPNKIEDHAAYVKSWIEILKKDKSDIFRISTEASNIADYVMTFDKEVVIENRFNQTEKSDGVDLTIDKSDLIKSDEIEKKIYPPEMAANPSTKWLAEVRYRGWALDSQRFENHDQAQKWLDEHSGKISESVSRQYAELMKIDPRELYKELLNSDPELIKMAEKLEATVQNPSYSDYENLLKNYNEVKFSKSPNNDFEIEP